MLNAKKSKLERKSAKTSTELLAKINNTTTISKALTKRPDSKVKKSRGGAREGAGRPKGSGKLGDTTSLRVPNFALASLKAARDAIIDGTTPADAPPPSLELFDTSVAAGFATPSEDHGSRSIDLYSLFSPKPESTFLIKISGWSLREAGIHDGDYLLVDRSIEPRSGHIVVAHIEGQGLVAKRLRIDKHGTFLDSANAEFEPIRLGEGSNAQIWGVARAKAGLLI